MKTRELARDRFSVLILLVLAVFSMLTVRCQAQLQWTATINIDVRDDGSASWLVQRKTPLLTDLDEALFAEYTNVTSVDELSDNINAMVDQASLATGRTMEVGGFQVISTVSTTAFGKEGVLQYQFVWTGFAEKTSDDKIMVGDALRGDLDLSSTDALTMVYPAGYVPSFVYPSPDEVEYSDRTLTWFGSCNFGAGEPGVLFEKVNTNWVDVLLGNAFGFFMAGVAVATGFLGYFVGRKRACKGNGLKAGVGEQELMRGFEDDEQKVVNFLSAAGGRLYQSAIVEQFGFSKSKASTLLSVMEKKGVITRKKSGREKIVTLTKSADGSSHS
ncbi:MAG TPA: MarR family transcriptional regulator [Candidatus Bathyarchaeia archaeon]